MSDQNSPSFSPFISAGKDIDVNGIMDSIQKRIQEKKDSGVLRQVEIDEIEDMELLPLPDFLEVPNVFENHLYPEHAVEPFTPFHMEPEPETGAIKKLMALGRKAAMPLLRFMLRPFITDQRNLTIELHNRNAGNIHNLQPVIPITFQSKEYIKLLHNAVNNLIVETSKMKIEEELLKTKIHVLEDKVQFLENRQRAVENRQFEGESGVGTPTDQR